MQLRELLMEEEIDSKVYPSFSVALPNPSRTLFAKLCLPICLVDDYSCVDLIIIHINHTKCLRCSKR